MGLLQRLFGIGSSNDQILDYLKQGAKIIDVRTPGEFKMGHVDTSKNIPLQQISGRISEVKKWNKPVILCCASGMRSKQATQILKNHGIDCINAGSWNQLDSVV